MAMSLGDVTDLYAGRLMPDIQVHTFRNTEKLFPVRKVHRGGAVRPFTYAAQPIHDLPIYANGQLFDLYDYVSRNRIAGLMIIQNGKVLLEQYELGNTPETRWLSMSMAKSFATTLIGCAIKDGFIGGQDDQLVLYLPQLRGSGYDGVSIRHLLQMTSGVEWDDTHTNSASHRRHMLVLQESMKPDAVLTYMASLPRVAQPGTVWNYSTGETHVVGALVKAATGKWLADYLSEKIWSQLGMEQDAHWWLESEGGLEVAGSGMTATLRDYVRFASFMLEGGGGILPENWIADATRVREAGGKPLPYGFMWWPVADNEGSFVDGAFSARGIFGQYLYINPARQIVIGVNSARAKPKFAEAILDNDFFNSVCRALA